jgi:hypothetical protein
MSTPNNSLGVLSDIAPLAERFVYLNFRYLVAVFYCLDLKGWIWIKETPDPEGAEFRSLYCGLFRCFATEYIDSSGSYTQHDLPALLVTHFVGDHMKGALSWVRTSMYSVVAPRELLTMIARYASSIVFFIWMVL